MTPWLRSAAVSSAGARLVVRLDDREAGTADLPDRDGRNDAGAAEYEKDFEFAIPAGVHRVTVDNDGPDWLALSRIEFRGPLADAPGR